jgi:hypothetical protein
VAAYWKTAAKVARSPQIGSLGISVDSNRVSHDICSTAAM